MTKNSLYLIVVFACGCSSGGLATISIPSFNPEAMTAAALKEFDKNNNGSIEGEELNACPALKSALARFDKNNDKKISGDELKVRFSAYAAANVSTMSASIRVFLDGQPLAEATVTFTPEACMGGAIKVTTGTTTVDGSILDFTIDGKSLPGMQPGLYRISVSKAGLSEKATKQPLGCEIFDGGRDGSEPIEFKLSSK